MRHQDVLCVTVLLFYFHAESSGMQQLNGVLREAVTFQINESKPFRTISWSRLENSKSSTVALVTPEKPCQIIVPLPIFQGRATTSKDCRNLQLSFLGPEDGARYTADVVLTSGKTTAELFDLKVYKRLQSADLIIQCVINDGGEKTLSLNCSAGMWDDSLDVSWSLEAESAGLSHGSRLTVNYTNVQVFDAEVTCRAGNPIGEASKRMTLREACPIRQRYSHKTGVVAGFIMAGVFVIAAFAAGVVLWLSKSPPRALSVPRTTSQNPAEGEPS